jgi:pimeloyl-ACP methyl ester carboxylesterase
MYQPIESPSITRHFVNLGDLQVHVRIAGTGPAAVMLHQSPTSSAEMATDIEACAAHLTVVAIDMPGYGLSDPLPDEHPDIGAFARVVERVITALGIERTVVYGFHTGAVVAFEFARLFPERCSGAVVNGLVCIEGEELADLLAHYNVLPEVTAEGAHLPWLWARLRDQTLFFPWYRKTPAARMTLDLHDGAFLHPYLVDFLRAKEGGRPGYQAAFSYPTRERAPQITAPVFLINFEPDPLTSHPERLPEFPVSVTRKVFADFVELHHASLAYMREQAAEEVEIPRCSVGDFAGRFRKEVVNTEAGPVFLRTTASAEGGTVVLLHDAGASSSRMMPLAERLADAFGGRRRVVCIDLPGHGETGDLQLPVYSAGTISILIGLVLKKIGVESAEVVADGAAALIANQFVTAGNFTVERLLVIDPWFFHVEEREQIAGRYAPKLMPGDYGQHLLEAWYYARDSELFWPWNEPHPQNALTRAPDIEPEHVQARTLDVLKAGIAFPRLVRDLLSADFDRPFTQPDCDVIVCARAGNGHEVRVREVAGLNARAQYHQVPASPEECCAAVVELLKRGP